MKGSGNSSVKENFDEDDLGLFEFIDQLISLLASDTTTEAQFWNKTLQNMRNDVIARPSLRRKANGVRDSIMAMNVLVLLEADTSRKIIIWAASEHTCKGYPNYEIKPMGKYLKDKLDSSYYSLGFVSYMGSSNTKVFNGKIKEPNEGTLEYEIKQTSSNPFVIFIPEADSMIRVRSRSYFEGQDSNSFDAYFYIKDNYVPDWYKFREIRQFDNKPKAMRQNIKPVKSNEVILN